MHVDFPFHLDARGQTAGTDADDHVRDLVEQLLFTSPGERVNRPTFGSGLMRLVFDPNSEQLATATETIVHGALQQWLGDLVHVESVDVSTREGTLIVEVSYIQRESRERQVARFEAATA